MSKTKSFIDFYLGKFPNENGMTIEQIFTFSEEELGAHHNFIQWLFPVFAQRLRSLCLKSFQPLRRIACFKISS